MKRRKRMPIPQKEFGFAPDAFNLFQEWTNDGQRIVREREQIQRARLFAEKAQRALFPK